MKENEILREQIFEIVENQLKANNPPETKMTYDRLKADGFDDLLSGNLYSEKIISQEVFPGSIPVNLTGQHVKMHVQEEFIIAVQLPDTLAGLG